MALTLVLAAVCLRASPALGHDGEDGAIDFGRDVRPILADNCFLCHGPDTSKRDSDLRLDLREEVFQDLGGYAAVVPGRSAASELYLRITDPDDPMPPPGSGKSLTTEEIERLGRWIDEGASWEEHWAYAPPRRPEPPRVAIESRARNDVDRFVLARLEAAELDPESEASRATLIRRVTLDLTGLPPTLAEVDAFLADERPDAYEFLVERLFASPRYGEHMARAWLDLARYGDTHGLHLDNERMIWPYRDWVVDAFNRNMPYDRFTVEQLAGDLLPDPTLDQLVATGFNRCTPTSAEGGMIEAEYLVKYAVERVDTTATVWLGTTMACAGCHDHKFDPISQREFYEFFAFFRGTAEKASDENLPSPPPTIAVPSPAERRELELLDEELASIRLELDAPMPALDARQAPWSAEWRTRLAARWRPVQTLLVESTADSTLAVLPDGSILAGGPNPDRDVYEILARTDLAGITAVRLEALRHESLGGGSIGRDEHGNIVLSEFELEYVGTEPGEPIPIPLATATADYAQEGFAVWRALDGDATTGWAVDGLPADRVAVFAAEEPVGEAPGGLLRFRLRFESDYPRHALGRFRLQVSDDPGLLPSALGPWYELGPFVAADDDAAHETDFGPESGVDLTAAHGPDALPWVPRPELEDGLIHRLEGEHCATYLYRTIDALGPRALLLALGTDDSFKLWLNQELVQESRDARPVAPDQDRVLLALVEGRNHLLLKVVNHGGDYGFTVRRVDEELGGLPLRVSEALLEPDGDETAAAAVQAHFRRSASPEWRAIEARHDERRARRAELDGAIPRTLIMQELEEPHPAHVLLRGQYDHPGDEVTPDTPALFPPLAAGEDRATRLDLARWLVGGDNPLTARVTVNRLWLGLFGAGLVASAEDFGSQGAWPSHPELLDWLACELVESGWDLRHVLRLMVESATYRQAARVSDEKLVRDPENRLLARGPRFRLDAERIRDQALALAGLLVERIGGPGVRPYQPDGVWQAVAYTSSNTAAFERDAGDALYRRSLYTFWKRTAPPPSMQLFDAPTRETCTVSRARTNTPLQALTLLNDVQFVEAARAFAQRALLEGGRDDAERLAWALRLATARDAQAGEIDVLRALLAESRATYAADPTGARALVGVGESEPDPSLDAIELAAWTQVTQVILNLDEVVTKE